MRHLHSLNEVPSARWNNQKAHITKIQAHVSGDH